MKIQTLNHHDTRKYFQQPLKKDIFERTFFLFRTFREITCSELSAKFFYFVSRFTLRWTDFDVTWWLFLHAAWVSLYKRVFYYFYAGIAYSLEKSISHEHEFWLLWTWFITEKQLSAEWEKVSNENLIKSAKRKRWRACVIFI